MVFSSLIFAFYFLPVVVALYYCLRGKWRNYLLLIASLGFYAYGEPRFVFIMLGSILVNYTLARVIDSYNSRDNIRGAGAILALDVLVNIGILFVFKYLDFAITAGNVLFRTNISLRGIALPIGISFFTFQAMSYVIDVYRKKVQVQKNLLNLALYISFFPQLVAGPIVRYSTIEQQIEHRTVNVDLFGEGVRRFVLGFSKKVLLANNLALVAEEVFAQNAMETNPLMLWLGAVCYSLQIFYDFSGYSDMAIGLGKMFGFEFEENFNYPYISRSVTEFWRRWHISLGQWFRDYVYIPLGGSKCSVARHIFNMLVVWSLTGIWHGANYTFIAWGLGYFILLVVEKYLIKPEKKSNIVLKILWQLITLICVICGWVIFNSATLTNGIHYCISMFGANGIGPSVDGSVIRVFREFGLFMGAGIIFATPVAVCIKQRIKDSFVEYLVPVGYALIFLWAVSYIVLGSHNPFIYFNF